MPRFVQPPAVPALAAAPAGEAGALYYNTTDGKLYFHDGTTWKEAAAAAPTAPAMPTATWAEQVALSDRLSPRFKPAAEVVRVSDKVAATPRIPDSVSLADRVRADLSSRMPEVVNLGDKIAPRVNPPADAFSLANKLHPRPRLPDRVNMSARIASARGTMRETVNLRDLVRVRLRDAKIKDHLDVYTNQSSPNFNYAGVGPLRVKFPTPVVNDGARAYLKFNLTNWPGWSVDASNAPMVWVSIKNDSLVTSQTVTINAKLFATDPWDETTITWNNAPSHTGADSVTFTRSINPGNSFYWDSFRPLFASSPFGKWVSLEFRIDATSTATVSIEAFQATDPTFVGYWELDAVRT